MLMMKGLMERALHHETALGRVRENAKLVEELEAGDGAET